MPIAASAGLEETSQPFNLQTLLRSRVRLTIPPREEYAAMNYRAYIAEAIGTFWLTFGGCGSAVIAAGFPQVGIGLLDVALAFGLTVVTMAYAIGHISGCHLNPAVTVGLTASGSFPAGQVIPYIVAQVVGAIVAALLLYAIGRSGFRSRQGIRD
jgi:aquaporin Z